MALKKWSIADFDELMSLNDGSSDFWTVSGLGTAEYYYAEGLDKKPSVVYLSGTEAVEGSLGSLAAGEWAWGDNDSLGNDALYVRLSDDSDPDSKAAGYVEVAGFGGTKNLITVPTNKTAFLFSLIISNYSNLNDAKITVTYTDGTNTTFQFFVNLLADNSPMAIDSMQVLESENEVIVTSDIDEVSVYASGDEA